MQLNEMMPYETLSDGSLGFKQFPVNVLIPLDPVP